MPRRRGVYLTNAAKAKLNKMLRQKSSYYKARNRFKIKRKKLALQPHDFVERVEDLIKLNSNTLQANGTLLVNYARSFKMNDIGQWANYKALFDDYILTKVVMELRYDYLVEMSAVASTTAQVLNPIRPLVLIKTDHNDASTGETWDTLKYSERSRLVQLGNGKKESHVIKPAAQVEAYKTVTASAYCPKWNTTIRTIDDTVPHYGVKIQVKTQPGPNVYDFGAIHIMYKYYFRMKNAE